ncbi:glycosyltransferase [Velocimicrobium porci]|uniref:Glycosyltransferase n=1 Tax=Velocimicrobium porci TaxID=2606634 RepID=A0A6L5XZF8_9FIRM|nr:glycosyltransferase [Velocimicrobium porci]MSS63861.1 glycosyltransferase [Velocimicrobium porci]
MKNKLSICIIMKNEASNLEKCLEKLKDLGDEIIVTDTGSTDGSREIAKKYTDKIFDFEWKNDFSAARNFAISKASNNWILVIDCDEFVQEYDLEKLDLLLEQYPQGIGRIKRVNLFTRDEEEYKLNENVNRLFSKKYYRYEGIIHEQVVHVKGEAFNKLFEVPVTAEHIGYESEIFSQKQKAERNKTLLLKQLKQKEDPYLLYQLGKTEYMQKNFSETKEYFEKAFTYDLEPKLEYVQDMVESYGYTLLYLEQYKEAMQLLALYDEFAVNADFIFLIGLIYMNNGHFKEAILEFQKATQNKNWRMEGVNSFRSWYNIGVIYECLGQKEKAISYYKKCGTYKKAKDGITRITSRKEK